MDRRAAAAYEAQLEFADLLDDVGEDLFAEDLFAEHADDAATMAAWLAAGLAWCVREAPTYAVADDVLTYLCDAAERWPGQPLLPADLPGSTGYLHPDHTLVLVPEGLPITTPDALRVISILWLDADDGVVLVAFGRGGAARHPVLVTMNLPFGSEAMTVSVRQPPGYPHLAGLLDRGPALANVMHVFWNFVQQEEVVRTAAPADRPTRRRAQRANLPAPRIVVVNLPRRRYVHSPAENDVVPTRVFSHRWVVHGFWRNQWYPSLRTHRQKWVHEYIKGPEDKPLASKRLVYRVRQP